MSPQITQCPAFSREGPGIVLFEEVSYNYTYVMRLFRDRLCFIHYPRKRNSFFIFFNLLKLIITNGRKKTGIIVNMLKPY